MTLLDVRELRTYFHTRNGVVRAVDRVSFAIDAGETVGIVGESGSGKSVLSFSLLGLIPSPPGKIESGAALFEGRDLLRCRPAALRRIRGKRIAMIFQDPMTALNPYLRIGRQLMEPLRIHDGLSLSEARSRALAALTEVGIADASARFRMYPHEMSGGLRQRVMIAMALIARPALLIADEPTTALDVTVQAQILELIRESQRNLAMAVMLITHDLGVVAGMCDRVLIMYAGRIMESAETRHIFYHSRHPYTRALIAARPGNGVPGAPLRVIPGQPPDLAHPMTGCPFAPRCSESRPECFLAPCELEEAAPGHATACIREKAGGLA